jgi:hypothetical protein
MSRSSDTASADVEVLFITSLCRAYMLPACEIRFTGEAASLLARVLCGERLLTVLRVGLTSRAWSSLNLCWVIKPDGCPAESRAAAPRLCADWSLRSWRCVRGDGGACSSVMRLGARDGIDSLVGLGIMGQSENSTFNYVQQGYRARHSSAEDVTAGG